MNSRIRSRCCLGLMTLLIVTAAGAAEDDNAIPKPLPAFQLTQSDGTTINSQDLPQREKWLLIYTTAECRACDHLLRLINKTEQPDLPDKVVVVVGGATPAKLKQLAEKFPDLAEASWFADPTKDGIAQLKLTATPVVFGLRDHTLAWCVLGILSGDSLKMNSLLASWVEK